jgi:STE24 endopeptidase
MVTSFFMMIILMIAPVFISPLFNNYTPMEEGPLKVEILKMAQANGVPTDNVWIVDAFKQSDRISANVSGLFGTTRISLNDNLLNRGTPEEIKAVMGHEIGHYVLGHGPEMLIEFSLVLLLAMLFIHGGFIWVQQRWGENWGVRDLADPAGLPVIFALLGVYFFLATPATNSIIRSNETEADSFAVNASQEPDGLATSLLKLTTYRKAEPGPWEEIIFFDHPSTRNRIMSAMRYKAVYQSEKQ